jgi:cytidyltransferase-like protein
VGEVVVLDVIYQQSAPWVCLDADGAFRLASPLPRVVFPGSFNPLHHGHTVLAERTAEWLGQPVAFVRSIVNVDKPNLTQDEVLRRLEQFRGRGPVFVTRAARIEEKATLFPGCIFVVGADTAARIVDPRYYRDDPAELASALERIRGLGCRFLVGGRADDCGRFVEVSGVAIPAEYRDLFMGFTEQQFRVDVSSTDLRQG